MKPMLAGTIKDPKTLIYPVLATPKIDGIRCLTILDKGKVSAVSRKLKPIPNNHVREMVELLNWGFDGELVVPEAKNFGETSSAIMRESGRPRFEYHVFDVHDVKCGYVDRLDIMANRLDSVSRDHLWVKPLIPSAIGNVDELFEYEEQCLSKGYEGVMVRSIDGPYKYGRSTVREGYLLKLKRFVDAEAEVIGVEEWLKNTNEQKRDALGYAERSSAKAGKTGRGALGALKCRMGEVEFDIGTGFTEQQRHEFWKEDLIGRIVKFKYQDIGGQEKPRFPVFLGFRHKYDT